jgi:hypothetical protein
MAEQEIPEREKLTPGKRVRQSTFCQQGTKIPSAPNYLLTIE